jgi:mRNA-degrading endonuclease YafQ of YafQ-DinJ toxin-antitoxin module
MFLIKTTTRFDRMLKNFIRSHPELRNRTTLIMNGLALNPEDSKFKVHSLGGVLKGAKGASINFRYRITFYLEDQYIWFLSIGSHEEAYG